jgi:hypothetical protein
MFIFHLVCLQVYEIEHQLQSSIFLAMLGFVNGCGCMQMAGGLTRVGKAFYFIYNVAVIFHGMSICLCGILTIEQMKIRM